MESGTWKIESCPQRDVRALVAALGVSETAAAVLVRRGYADPEAARVFLEGALPGHDPFSSLGDMRDAVETIVAAVEAGARICVHGDYDADGICASALAVLLLRELGAEPAWHLPSRFEEGYGLNGQTLARLAEEEFELVLTVDCGITAVAEVEDAKRLGLEVVITDHHRPADSFPDCPVVATLKGDYPFAGLCGTGVVWKLAEALLGPGHAFLDRSPGHRRPRDRRRRRAARRRESRARARRFAPARADAEGGAARPHARRRGRSGRVRRVGDRVPARAADQRVGSALPAGGGAAAAADGGSRPRRSRSRRSSRA